MMRDDSAMNFHSHNFPLLPEQEFRDDFGHRKKLPIISEIDLKTPFSLLQTIFPKS
jgi:hypothetical protein